MKRLFFGLLLLILVVAASGCTSETEPAEKTFSANGVSFTYPGNWSELNATSFKSQMSTLGEVLVVVGDDNTQLAVSKATISADQRLASLSEWASGYNNSMKSGGSTYVSEKSLSVAGADAYMMTFQESGYYVTNVAIIKSGTGYLITFASKTNDQQILETILNSLSLP